MRIRTKIVLIFLPLIITPLVLTTAAASLAARNGITGVATGLLRFKAEQLESYARGQWSLLTANNLQGNPRFVDAVRDGIGAFAAGLVRSPSELILAVDDAGRVAMASGQVELSASETQELAILAQMQSRGWRSARLAGTARVIQTFYFEPLQWLVVVSEESRTFYSAVTRIYSQSGLIAAASLAVTLVLILLFSHYLTDPLREVVAAMRDIITSSDLSRRVAISYQDETGELAHTFNLMTGELEKAHSQIKSYALRASVAERQRAKAAQRLPALRAARCHRPARRQSRGAAQGRQPRRRHPDLRRARASRRSRKSCRPTTSSRCSTATLPRGSTR